MPHPPCEQDDRQRANVTSPRSVTVAGLRHGVLCQLVTLRRARVNVQNAGGTNHRRITANRDLRNGRDRISCAAPRWPQALGGRVRSRQRHNRPDVNGRPDETPGRRSLTLRREPRRLCPQRPVLRQLPPPTLTFRTQAEQSGDESQRIGMLPTRVSGCRATMPRPPQQLGSVPAGAGTPKRETLTKRGPRRAR
jgi:hypothetical protein